jgi:hypothetical protein
MPPVLAKVTSLKKLIWTGLGFSRPYGTKFGNGVLTFAPKPGVFTIIYRTILEAAEKG